jgi:hypothetical protein
MHICIAWNERCDWGPPRKSECTDEEIGCRRFASQERNSIHGFTGATKGGGETRWNY